MVVVVRRDSEEVAGRAGLERGMVVAGMGGPEGGTAVVGMAGRVGGMQEGMKEGKVLHAWAGRLQDTWAGRLLDRLEGRMLNMMEGRMLDTQGGKVLLHTPLEGRRGTWTERVVVMFERSTMAGRLLGMVDWRGTVGVGIGEAWSAPLGESLMLGTYRSQQNCMTTWTGRVVSTQPISSWLLRKWEGRLVSMREGRWLSRLAGRLVSRLRGRWVSKLGGELVYSLAGRMAGRGVVGMAGKVVEGMAGRVVGTMADRMAVEIVGRMVLGLVVGLVGKTEQEQPPPGQDVFQLMLTAKRVCWTEVGWTGEMIMVRRDSEEVTGRAGPVEGMVVVGMVGPAGGMVVDMKVDKVLEGRALQMWEGRMEGRVLHTWAGKMLDTLEGRVLGRVEGRLLLHMWAGRMLDTPLEGGRVT